MCTLSFLPEADGYVVAMNRDELKSRAVASVPAIHQLSNVSAVYPQEVGGGTWVAATSRGNLFALLNWNQKAGGLHPAKQKSRGEIIPSLLCEDTPAKVESALRNVALHGTLPFRLICIFATEKLIQEWRWNGKAADMRWNEWVRNHWFSSSRSDVRAEAVRRRACEMMWQDGLQDTREWLRCLHASHLPDAGAYSICVHREDATTVSFTEVQHYGAKLEMRYTAGHPCAPEGAVTTATIPIDEVSRSAHLELAE